MRARTSTDTSKHDYGTELVQRAQRARLHARFPRLCRKHAVEAALDAALKGWLLMSNRSAHRRAWLSHECDAHHGRASYCSAAFALR